MDAQRARTSTWRGDRPGPLEGVRVVEVGSIGPGPFCAMLLADLGADIIRLDRPEEVDLPSTGLYGNEVLHRSRRSVAIDLKHPDAAQFVLELADRADVLIEGFRPGVVDRLGIGPTPVLQRNPRLVYGRMTGWGEEGPLAKAAGHDVNYLALSGVLAALGPGDVPPAPPLNLVGDYAGGGMLLALGIVSALFRRGVTGCGQVVDAAMVDGAALLMGPNLPYFLNGAWGERGESLIDGGAPYYRVYETADGRHVAFGAMEPPFYVQMLEGLGLADVDPAEQNDRSKWAALRARIAVTVRSRSRDAWEQHFSTFDACFSPVLHPLESAEHPHHRARHSFVESGGVAQPAPAPLFSGTPLAAPSPACRPGEHTRVAPAEWGVPAEFIAAAERRGVLRQAPSRQEVEDPQ
jgi:alpha-methylacyl-CoA racemase